MVARGRRRGGERTGRGGGKPQADPPAHHRQIGKQDHATHHHPIPSVSVRRSPVEDFFFFFCSVFVSCPARSLFVRSFIHSFIHLFTHSSPLSSPLRPFFIFFSFLIITTHQHRNDQRRQQHRPRRGASLTLFASPLPPFYSCA